MRRVTHNRSKIARTRRYSMTMTGSANTPVPAKTITSRSQDSLQCVVAFCNKILNINPPPTGVDIVRLNSLYSLACTQFGTRTGHNMFVDIAASDNEAHTAYVRARALTALACEEHCSDDDLRITTTNEVRRLLDIARSNADTADVKNDIDVWNKHTIPLVAVFHSDDGIDFPSDGHGARSTIESIIGAVQVDRCNATSQTRSDDAPTCSPGWTSIAVAVVCTAVFVVATQM